MDGNMSATVASGDVLDVREIHVHQALSSLFDVTLTVLSDNPDIDFEAVIGQDASFTLHGRVAGVNQLRTWSGVAAEMHQIRVETAGLSTYHLRLVPTLWLTTHRRNHRMFQMKSELDIVELLLGEWGIEYDKRITGTYKKRKYRVQYGETDYVFLSRMLEDAGITFYFEEQGGATRLVLADAPQKNDLRTPPIAFRDEPTVADREHVTSTRVGRRVRPGKYTMRDVDYRRPASYPLLTTAAGAAGVEQRLERFHYTPGAFLFESDKGGDTPTADDRGQHRTDEAEGQKLAQKRLAANRGDALTASFAANVIDLWPGVVMTVLDHPHRALGDGRRLLVTESRIDAVRNADLHCHVEVRSADAPYHPELKSPKPKAHGVESAVVVGPAGEEIHADEFGRVRVQFHWDREGAMNEKSSCWIPVSQPWGGAGYGGTNLPRVGQEVLVDFLGGDPDRPMITGRVYTNLQKTPYKLPANKTQSGWKSNSSPTTGGYNELMFEDAAGQELLRMQAEKDLHKLVKHDEAVVIGNDRTKQIGRDDTHDTGRNRKRSVGNDEAVDVGNDEARSVANDRTRSVGNDEAVSVGNDRSKTIGGNEDTQIAGNQSRAIGGNHSSDIGGDQKGNVGGSKLLDVAKTLLQNVGIASNEGVGVSKSLEVGQTYSIKVGKAISTQVGETSTEEVGKSMTVAVGEVYELTCGASTIHVDSGGNVTISATKIQLVASGPILLKSGGVVEVQAASTVKVQGGTVDIN
jgi:type VI secretion system secreted protein VgrG